MYDLWPVNLSRSTPPLLLCHRAPPFLSKYEIRLLLLQTRLSNQHLSWQQRKGPSLHKCVWVKMEEGDSLAAERRGGKKKKRPNNRWSVKVWNFSFPFSSCGKRRKLSRSRDCEMLFFISLLWGTRKPEKPRLQQFSNHPISKLRSFRCCAPFRPPETLCRLLCASRHVCGLGWNYGKLFLKYAVTFSHLFYPAIAYPGTMQSGYLKRHDVRSVLVRAAPPSPPSLLTPFSTLITFSELALCIDIQCTLPPCVTILSLACIFISFPSTQYLNMLHRIGR